MMNQEGSTILRLDHIELSDLHESLVEFYQIDPKKSFKGWLTSLTGDEFLNVQKSFESESEDSIATTLIRMLQEPPNKGDLFYEDEVNIYNFWCKMDVDEIGLYRKGYIDLVSRDEEGWVFKINQKGIDYLENKNK